MGAMRIFTALFATLLVVGAGTRAQLQSPTPAAGETLFDGKTLTNWRPSKFYGQGTVTIEDGAIILGTGKDLTGVTWSGPALPTTNYELTLQARRVEGRDFFAGITFAVGDSFCLLILGRWVRPIGRPMGCHGIGSSG